MKESLEHQKYKAGFAATWMDIETVILSEVSQTEKEMSSDIPYIWNLKRSDTNQLTKQNRLSDSENKFMFTRRKDGEGIVREFGMYTLLYLKWITNKGQQYST